MKMLALGFGHATKANGEPILGWPITLHFAPEKDGANFYCAEGDARNGNGGFFRAAQLLEPQWRSHLESTNTLWLLPILERMARGEDVSVSEIVAAYQNARGKPPIVEEWPE